MAKVLKQQKSLDSAFKKRAGVGLGLVVLGVVVGVIISKFFTQLGIVGVVVGATSIISGILLIARGYKFKVGAVGEGLVAQVLSGFPDDWYVFNDMIVGRSQIDHIVVCPKGVYTIETKNYRGSIYGHAERQEWSQVINYATTFYNPVKQGTGHSVALSKYLERSGFTTKIWVNTIVVFTEPSVELKVFSPKVPVVYLSELSEFLDKQKQTMSPEHCAKITECISKLIPVKRGNRLC